jgi:hypothetical protein
MKRIVSSRTDLIVDVAILVAVVILSVAEFPIVENLLRGSSEGATSRVGDRGETLTHGQSEHSFGNENEIFRTEVSGERPSSGYVSLY